MRSVSKSHKKIKKLKQGRDILKKGLAKSLKLKKPINKIKDKGVADFKKFLKRINIKGTQTMKFGLNPSSNVYGPGYKGQTSFVNALSAPYFGYQEPFINASEWWYPVAGGAYQSPNMLYDVPSAGPYATPAAQ